MGNRAGTGPAPTSNSSKGTNKFNLTTLNYYKQNYEFS